MNNTEIERKFLIKKNIEDLPLNTAIDVVEIIQGYLCINKENKDEVRLRMSIPGDGSDALYTISAKKGTGLVRGEYEVYIDIWQFGVLWKAVDKLISKKRYKIPYMGYVIELDIFEGNLQDLIIAEIEFQNELEANKFVSPAWLVGAADVTLDSRYKNQSLVNGMH